LYFSNTLTAKVLFRTQCFTLVDTLTVVIDTACDNMNNEILEYNTKLQLIWYQINSIHRSYSSHGFVIQQQLYHFVILENKINEQLK